MTAVRTSALTAAALAAALAAQQANAQDLRGFRVEAQAGYDRFYSEGNSNSEIGYGGAAGVDFDLGGFVLGPEVTFRGQAHGTYKFLFNAIHLSGAEPVARIPL